MMNEHQTSENITGAHRVSEEISASNFFHAEWERAQPVHLIRYWSGEDAPPERHAEARLIWSQEALGVRFVCRQSEPIVMRSAPQTAEKTVGLWERDVCEIFVAPESSETEHYFEFEAAPTGEWIDLEIRWKPEARETDWHYISGMTAAGRIEEEHVLIALRVPWEAFRRRPQPGELWRVNFFRCVGIGPERGYLSWQPTRTVEPNFHAPQAFGWLRFDE
ncbi:MAG TPA: carbohydrate-binding family 9-like protein [Pyrinomonadaceae bacterium]|nr:carbohydrate-binding family 9-like protein [Pyrinomonadaceae bacterium]